MRNNEYYSYFYKKKFFFQIEVLMYGCFKITFDKFNDQFWYNGKGFEIKNDFKNILGLKSIVVYLKHIQNKRNYNKVE